MITTLRDLRNQIGLRNNRNALTGRQEVDSRERRFSLFRVAAATQVASACLSVWFAFFSLKMSCSMSGAVGGSAIITHSLTSVLLLAAVLLERRWSLLPIPFVSWFVFTTLVAMSMH